MLANIPPVDGAVGDRQAAILAHERGEQPELHLPRMLLERDHGDGRSEPGRVFSDRPVDRQQPFAPGHVNGHLVAIQAMPQVRGLADVEHRRPALRVRERQGIGYAREPHGYTARLLSWRKEFLVGDAQPFLHNILVSRGGGDALDEGFILEKRRVKALGLCRGLPFVFGEGRKRGIEDGGIQPGVNVERLVAKRCMHLRNCLLK